jgi:hypothetical protein
MATHADKLTWAALLGRWIEFARSAVALPDDEAGRAVKQCIPDIIMLQAVWFALDHLDDLPPDERALGLDRAEVLIDQHAAAIERRFAGMDLPDQLRELIADARQRLARRQGG